MKDNPGDSSPSTSPIPADDPRRTLVVARPADERSLTHVGVAGDTYTILLSGNDTAGRFCLIDMHVPPGAGPPPHRHDFEEAFTVLDGEIELTFRGETSTVRAGDTVNIPANAPHRFRNAGTGPVALHLLARGPGGVLPGDRCPGRNADDTPASPRRGGPEGAARPDPGACATVPVRAAPALTGTNVPLRPED